jgi:hypothetical protein
MLFLLSFCRFDQLANSERRPEPQGVDKVIEVCHFTGGSLKKTIHLGSAAP